MSRPAHTPEPEASTPTATRPEGASDSARPARGGVTLAVVLLGFLILPMGMSGTTVAVPRIGADLGASGSALQWVVTGYFLAASSFMLVAGSMGDLFGRRRVYRLGAIVYTAGSVAAAFAPTILLLDAARTLTGIGAAGVMAGGGAILATTFTGPARMKAFAAMGSTSGVGLAIGPTAAGWLVDGLGWRATFGVFGAVGLLLIAGTWALTESRAAAKPRVDKPGVAAFITGLALVMFAITQGAQAGWGSARVLVPGAGGLVVLAVFVVVERRSDHPMLNLSLLADRRFSGWLLAAMTAGVGFGGMLANLPTYLQGANGLSTGEAGLVMLMATVPVLVLPQLGGRLVDRGLPPRVLVTAALLMSATGNAWLTVLHPGIGAAGLLGPLVMIGSAQGLVAGVIDAQAMNSITPERAGMAAGMLNTVRGSTQALTMALFGSALITLLEHRLGNVHTAGRVATGDLPGGPAGTHLANALTDAWQVVLLVIAALVTLAAAAVFTLLRPRGKQPATTAGMSTPQAPAGTEARLARTSAAATPLDASRA
ncbi:MAG: MFS transporter [Streptomycetaceae bacterium]|nr:MFS transporter [Streptomycetaceae bacterium]